MKRPSFQFYPGDWLSDPKVSVLSDAAEGLYIRLLCYAHQSEKRGFLMVNGIKITPIGIQKLSKTHPKRFQKVFLELTSLGLFLEDEKTGAFYNPRMVKDTELERLRAECGKLGGNPNLVNQKVNQGVNKVVNHPSNQKPTPSSSSSPSGEDERGAPKAPPLSSSEVTPENLARLSDDELHQVGEMLKIEPKGETHRQRIDRAYLEDMWWAELMIRNRGPAKQEGAR